MTGCWPEGEAARRGGLSFFSTLRPRVLDMFFTV